MPKVFILPWLPCWVVGVLLSLALPFGGAVYWLAAALLCVLLWIWGRQPWLGWVLAVLLGCAYGVWRAELALAQQWPPVVPQQAVPLVITVVAPPQQDERRVRFEVIAYAESGERYRLQLSDYRSREWPLGSRWQVGVRVRPMVGEVNAVGFNREAWALANGIQGVGSIGQMRERLPESAAAAIAWQRYRADLSARWQATAADYPLGAALMRALSLGEQAALPQVAWQAFRPLGINHLVSISGLHIGLVALWAGWLMRWTLRWLPWQPAQPKLWWLAAGVAAALFYAALAGFAVPTQRALLMLLVLAWGWWRQRHQTPWQVWWAALALVLLFDPLSALAPGFWLSFGLVAALLWAGSGRVAERGLRWRAWRTALRAQWAAALASLVLVAYFFGTVPLLSPLVNAVAIPWFSWLLVPLALLGLLLPWQAPLMWMAALAEYTLRALMWLGEYAPVYAPAQPPWPVLLLGAAAVLVLLLPRGVGLRPWACLCLLMLLGFRQPLLSADTAKITVWDVGQGLAVSVQTRQRHLLFDTGTAAATEMQLLPNLRAQGVRGLDVLVLSHQDADHDGGTAVLRQVLKPQRVFAGQPQAYAGADWCAGGLNWVWDGVWFEFLTLPVASPLGDNDHSCVLRVVAGDKALLLTGDLGVRGEAALLAEYGEDVFSQVLILGHHGSRTSSSPAFLRRVRPEWAVASSGFANAYRHPHPQVVDLLALRQVALYRTDKQGGASVLLAEGQPLQWQPLRPRVPFWQRKPLRGRDD